MSIGRPNRLAAAVASRGESPDSMSMLSEHWILAEGVETQERRSNSKSNRWSRVTPVGSLVRWTFGVRHEAGGARWSSLVELRGLGAASADQEGCRECNRGQGCQDTDSGLSSMGGPPTQQAAPHLDRIVQSICQSTVRRTLSDHPCPNLAARGCGSVPALQDTHWQRPGQVRTNASRLPFELPNSRFPQAGIAFSSPKDPGS